MSKRLPFRIWCNGCSHLSQQNRGQWTHESLFFLLGSLLRFVYALMGVSCKQHCVHHRVCEVSKRRLKISNWRSSGEITALEKQTPLKTHETWFPVWKKLMGCKTSKRWSSHLLDSMRIEPLFLSSKLSWFFQNCLGCARMISLSHLSQVKAKQNG